MTDVALPRVLPPEFSRMVDAVMLPADPLVLSADETECAALAERFGLESIAALDASIGLEPDGAAVIAQGTLRADIVQSCAVTGDDLPVEIRETVSLRFVREGTVPPDHDEEVELSADELDDIEFTGQRFDLGEAIAQSLGLAIDPYAEGPDAASAREAGLISSEAASGPFAALAALKKT